MGKSNTNLEIPIMWSPCNSSAVYTTVQLNLHGGPPFWRVRGGVKYQINNLQM